MWINVKRKKTKTNKNPKSKKYKENIGKLFGTDVVVLTGYTEKTLFHLFNNELVYFLLSYLISLSSIKENDLTRRIEQTWLNYNWKLK